MLNMMLPEGSIPEWIDDITNESGTTSTATTATTTATTTMEKVTATTAKGGSIFTPAPAEVVIPAGTKEPVHVIVSGAPIVTSTSGTFTTIRKI